jgi:hypothetical protein
MNTPTLKLPPVCRWLKHVLHIGADAAPKAGVAKRPVTRHHRRKITTVFFEMP